MPYFQMNTIAPPEIIPASAPMRVVRFQNSANSTTGPKAAPKPAHAKDTIVKTEFSFLAQIIATIAMAIIVRREISIDFLLSILSLNTPTSKSCDMLDDAASS